ncbi:hypothetical protein HG536_0B06980 [Torulaspora globosa]|uniref:Uncharacterized protein n=1 Tax=Torulaspora globosa TaxID=48254 RepID=A0A7G3ZE94_9SACH|nr:uncharacterized protein HG536_0B06980 [Torulaspora globosa]QLL31830.1 hypothetical protein HG536_0B06980 [Torulaspora globosa]
MTPATPPASRGGRGSRPNYALDEALQGQKSVNEPQTPHRERQSHAPVTPSTTRAFKHSIPLLGPPSLGNQSKSPFKGFNSPEYTPQNQLSKNKAFSFEHPEELQNVSRVLFPAVDEGKSLSTGEAPAPSSLLPPRRPVASARRLLGASLAESEESDEESPHKLSKQVPGTPSHKVITFDMAEEWNNATAQRADSDDENLTPGSCIKDKELENPFLAAGTADRKLIQQRKDALLRENPDIESVITYVNKKGDVVRRRQLSEDEKELYKPRRLFANEIEELETGKKEDKK